MEKKQLIQLMTEQQLIVPSLLLERYKDLGLTDTECMLVIHLHQFISKGNTFPTPDDLSAKMTLNATECSSMLRALVQKGVIQMVQTKTNNLFTEIYSLEPLWEKCIDSLQEAQQDEDRDQQEMDLYTVFEKEFGRPLSPIECETLAMWLDDDHHEALMVKAALREAVISGKLNFRYIDRILFDWKKQGVKTLDQAKVHSEKVRGRFQTPSASARQKTVQSVPQMPLYNWLDQS